MMRKLLPATLCLLLTTAQAQNRTETTFTYTTTAQRQNFQKHWQLSDQELARYEEVMINEGRFRYPKLTPVEILAITAKDDETMRYYAKKAAADEMRAVRAQLAYAVMVTEEKTKNLQRTGRAGGGTCHCARAGAGGERRDAGED